MKPAGALAFFSFAAIATCGPAAAAPWGAPPASPPLAPLEYMTGAGAKTYPEVQLLWGALAISIVVCILVSIFVVAGVVRRASRQRTPGAEPVLSSRGGLGWIGWGVGLTSPVLLGVLVWTMIVLAGQAAPHTAPLTIEVTGLQWWWKARYLSQSPANVFVTANEIHVPAGEPVRIKLISADVIHSFWPPQLSGKTDAIPGQTNITWLEADKSGWYRGQCTEYCGAEHALMGFYIVADPPARFRAWWAQQLRPAATPADPAAQRGEAIFDKKCGACHTVRGGEASGAGAPDLTHLMSRATLAGAALPNTPYALSGWISNPQAVKPGTLMPITYLSGPQLADLLAYLETLK